MYRGYEKIPIRRLPVRMAPFMTVFLMFLIVIVLFPSRDSCQ
ncbi:hypothetical protein BH20ACT11_BH20ACT11_03550 [soil metagenome]